METAHFDQKTVDRIRRAATRAAKLPPDLPEGWCRSPQDFNPFIAASVYRALDATGEHQIL